MSGSKASPMSVHREILVQQNKEREAMISRCFDAAFEYGLFCIKNLLLLNGAGLLALPGLAGLMSLSGSDVVYSAASFVLGIAAAIAAAYAVGWNYLQNALSRLNKKYSTDLEIYNIDIDNQDHLSNSRAPYDAAENWHNKMVEVTFFFPHAAGICSGILFVVGCFMALSAIEVS